MPDVKHLWNRGKAPRTRWYLKLPIPRPLRSRWPVAGKDYIVKPLDTGDLTVAQRRRDELTVAFRHVFDRLQAGEQLTAQQVKAATAIEAKFNPRAEGAIRAFGGEPLLMALREAAITSGMPLDAMRAITALTDAPIAPPALPEHGETITQALEAWLAETQSDKATEIRAGTISGHRGRVKAFTNKFGDLPLAKITRENASKFLSGLKCKNQTRNQYAMTLKAIIEGSRKRGAFPKNEDNPFDGQRRKFERTERDRYTDQEAVRLLNAFGKREVAPKRHTP